MFDQLIGREGGKGGRGGEGGGGEGEGGGGGGMETNSNSNRRIGPQVGVCETTGTTSKETEQ